MALHWHWCGSVECGRKKLCGGWSFFNERRLHVLGLEFLVIVEKYYPVTLGEQSQARDDVFSYKMRSDSESSKSKGRLGSRLCFFSNYVPPKIRVSHYYSQSSFLGWWCQFSILFFGVIAFPMDLVDASWVVFFEILPGSFHPCSFLEKGVGSGTLSWSPSFPPECCWADEGWPLLKATKEHHPKQPPSSRWVDW